jgi:hypothetical protein
MRPEQRKHQDSVGLRTRAQTLSDILQPVIKEIRMNIVYVFGLATIMLFSQSLHAQSCSGGTDGGMDATGNQCNAPGSVATHTTAPVAAPPDELNWKHSSGRARPLAIRLSKNSMPQFRASTLAMSASRTAAAVIAPPTTTKNERTFNATCSGGADGGMDATGNQCSE